MRIHHAAARAAFAAALSFCEPAFAEDAVSSGNALDADATTREQARAAYQAGVTAYRAGDYEAAFARFKKAHDLVPAVRVEFWMAMSASYCNDHVAAHALLEGVLASPDADRLGPEKLSSVRARLQELKTKSEPVPAASPPSSSAQPESSAPPDAASVEDRASRWPAYATLGGAAVFGVFATTYGILALNASNAYDRDHSTLHHDTAQRDALFAGLGAVMTVGLGITGFVLISADQPAAGSAGATGNVRAARLRLDVLPTAAEKPNGLAVKLTLSL